MFPSSSSSQMSSGFSGFATRSTTASSFSPATTPFGIPSMTTSLAGNSNSGFFGTPSVFMQGNQRGNLFPQSSTWTGLQTSSPLSNNTQTTFTLGNPSSNFHGTSTSGGSVATRSTFNSGGFNSTPPSLFSSTSPWAVSTTPVQPNPFGVPTTSNSNTPVKPNPFEVPTTSTWKYPGPTSTLFPSQPNIFSSFANTSLPNATSTSAPSNSFNPFAPTTNLTSPASTVSSVSVTLSNHNPFTSFNSLATQSFPSSSSSTLNPVQTNTPPPSLFSSTSSWATNSVSTTPVQPNPFGVPTTSNSITPVKPFPFEVPTTSTWKYPGPTSTLFPSQPNIFSSSANTSLPNATSTSAPSNSFNPFAPTTNLTSPASTVSSVSVTLSNHNPFTSFNSLATQSFPSSSSSTLNPGQTNTPPWNAFWSTSVDKPSNSFVTTAATSHPPLNNNPNTNPFTSQTTHSSSSSSFPSFTAWTSAQASTPSWPPITSGPSVSMTTAAANSVSVVQPPLNHNPVTNCFTSLATYPSSSSSSPTSTAWTPAQASTPSSLNAFLTTPISRPPISTMTAAASSVSVSPVISGPSSNFNQPTALCNPYVSSTQNCNGEKTGIIGQISSSQITSMEQPSSAASPFGILPPKPQLFFEDSQPIQIGISSIPVKDKPAAVRYQVLTTRHLSRNKLPIRKYDPKLNAPKIPFFNDTKEIPVDILIPRENPRKLVISPASWSPKANTLKKIGEEKKSSDSLYENEKEDNKASDDPTTEQELFATILEVPIKLQLPDYYTKPQISDLEAKERAEPGFCRRVKDFVVGRHGYGSIKFLGETDVRKLDIESLIQFNNREVIVYMDETNKPAVGEGLNKAAEITLLNIKCVDRKTGMQYKEGSKMNKYVEMLKKKATAQGAEFMSYDPVEGEWKFRVQHF